jgi:single-strand DNA-binding protein
MRYTQSGQPVSNFSLATDETYVGKDGQRVEKAEFHRIVVWGKQAEFCGNYLSKGRMVYVEGKLETRKWTDKDGAEKYTTEIKADRVQGLDKRSEGEAAPMQPAGKVREEFGSGPSGMDDAPFMRMEEY